MLIHSGLKVCIKIISINIRALELTKKRPPTIIIFALIVTVYNELNCSLVGLIWLHDIMEAQEPQTFEMKLLENCKFFFFPSIGFSA